MSAILPGSVHVGQIVRKITRTSVGVWLLDNERGFSAYGPSVVKHPVGTIVICRIDKEGHHIDKLRPAPESVKRHYASRALLPQTEPREVYVGQVIDKITDSAVAVWLLDKRCRMQAVGVKADLFPQGTVVYCRVDAASGFLDKLRKVPPHMEKKYASKRVIP